MASDKKGVNKLVSVTPFQWQIVMPTRTYYLRKCKMTEWGVFFESIPDEVLFEILLRLPAQDIYFAAALVCRKWYHMTRTKQFIYTHLKRSSYGTLYWDSNDDLVFISPREDEGGIFFDTYKLNHQFSSKGEFLSTCNGLILTVKCDADAPGSKQYFVTNALTNRGLRLPLCPFRVTYYDYPSPIGIGYDTTSMRYKVVVSYCEPGYGTGFRKRVAILTLGVDKSWRIVSTDHLSDLGMYTLGAHTNTTEGFIHWNKDEDISVVTLNLETEIIAETPPPIPKVVPVDGYPRCFCLSTGRYLSFFLQRSEDFVWEYFEMKPEIGEWKKLPNICLKSHVDEIERLGFDYFDDYFEPYGWLKYPKVLAFAFNDWDGFVISYDLIKCQIGAEKFQVYDNNCLFRLHKNSMVSLDGS